MNVIRLRAAVLCTAALAFCGAGCADQAQMDAEQQQAMSGERMPTQKVDRDTVDKMTAQWPQRPKMGAAAMLAKYGEPQEATTERLVWHNAGPFKRITAYNLETPHDFPLPHVDFLEHTVTYNVPQDKVADVIAMDGSTTIQRTTGELSARCDLESHNVLTLNLNHDIVTGKKSVEQARQAFGEIVRQEAMGQKPAYVEALQFQPQQATAARFSDQPVIPGSPVRADNREGGEAQLASGTDGGGGGDAEVLATVITVDRNQINAALAAQQKTLGGPVAEFAVMLNKEHGTSMDKTMKLGQQIGTKPLVTPDVQAVEKKAAGELAALLPLDGPQFEKAYLAAMVAGHTEVLQTIDGKLMQAARNDAVKQHLTETRQHVAQHLEQAKSLQSNAGR